MASVLSEIVSILVGGIQSLGTGIASGANAFVKALFIDSTGGTNALSTFGGIAAVFGGIALAVGLTTMLFTWIRTLGN